MPIEKETRENNNNNKRYISDANIGILAYWPINQLLI